MDVLVKLLDSGIRLPMQCHPDRVCKGISTGVRKGGNVDRCCNPGKREAVFGFNKKMNQEESTKLWSGADGKECMTECVNEFLEKRATPI
ncbi:MAG: hypothetical protein ACLUNG_11810 [[Clostridium] leptum]